MKQYLVIGGSSGIGKAIVNQLAEAGNRVFATFNTETEVRETELISYHHYEVGKSELNFDFLPAILDGFVYCPRMFEFLIK